MKKLFVLCDGTWQDGINNNSPLTNVATLARCLQPVDSRGRIQLVWYDSGVGNVTSPLAQRIDGATGRGISAKIRNAYSFIAHNYDFTGQRDEIILVGFSRGAFAVQCLASLISQTGLLEKKYLYYLRGMFTLWANQQVKGGAKALKDQVERLKISGVLHEVRIKALAVWDTVSSLGIFTQLSPQLLSFVGKKIPTRVDFAFHALALDEKRRKFQPCVWDSIEEGDHDITVSQCWFLGSHGDIGGNADAALGAVTLLWMIGKLSDHVGVAFDETEIGKHLRYKYLEWEFKVNKLFNSFEETRVLSTMPHSGQATKAAWYWVLLGSKPRASYLKSPVSDDDLSIKMKIHFTVRLVTSRGSSKTPRETEPRNECAALRAWEPRSMEFSPNKWQWKSSDGTQTLQEDDLKAGKEINMERTLLSKWCHGDFPQGGTDRTGFAKLQKSIQDPGSRRGLDNFALFLKRYVSRLESGTNSDISNNQEN